MVGAWKVEITGILFWKGRVSAVRIVGSAFVRTWMVVGECCVEAEVRAAFAQRFGNLVSLEKMWVADDQ